MRFLLQQSRCISSNSLQDRDSLKSTTPINYSRSMSFIGFHAPNASLISESLLAPVRRLLPRNQASISINMHKTYYGQAVFSALENNFSSAVTALEESHSSGPTARFLAPQQYYVTSVDIHNGSSILSQPRSELVSSTTCSLNSISLSVSLSFRQAKAVLLLTR